MFFSSSSSSKSASSLNQDGRLELTPKQRRLILIGISLASFMTPFGMSMLNLSLPEIGLDFHAGAHALGWVSTAYLFSSVLFLIPMARLSDLYGRKKVFSLGMVIAVCTACLGPFSPSFWFLVLLRIFDGFAMACVFATSLPILSSIYPPTERGSAFGINVALVYLGSSMGPVIGGLMTAHLGWRSLFFLLIPLALFSLLIVRRILKTDFIESAGEPFDKKGAVLYMISILFLLFGLSNLPETWAFILLAIGLIMFPLFVLYSRKQTYPIVQIHLFFTNKRFARSNFATFLNYAGTYAIIFFLSLYLQRVLLHSADTAGFLLLAQPALQAIFSPFVGRLADKVDSRYLTALGMIAAAFGLLGLSALHSDSTMLYLIGCQMLIGFGLAFFAAPNTSSIMNSVGKKDYSTAGASLSIMRQSGMVLSMAIAMCAITIFLGSTEMIQAETVPLFLTAMKATFCIGAICCFAGAILSYFRGPENIEESADF